MVFPLYDENPFAKPVLPYVTWTLLVVNVFVFLYGVASGEEGQQAMLASFAAVPAALIREVPAGAVPPEAVARSRSMENSRVVRATRGKASCMAARHSQWMLVS